MKATLLVIQIFLAISLIGAIAIQVKSGGFSRNFTAGSFTRRGLERLVFRGTFVLVFVFVVVSVLELVV